MTVLSIISVGKDRVVGATPGPDYESSSAVAVDGSAQVSEGDADHSAVSESPTLRSGLLARLRATVRAPVGSLRRFLVVLVFGTVLYLRLGL
jgi:hypothetical protein